MQQPNCTNVVVLPKDAAEALRQKLGLAKGEKPRISYLSVASDAAKSLRDYQEFGFDPSVPKATFGSMFFELVEKLDAEGQVFSFVSSVPFGVPAVRVDQLTKANRFQTALRGGARRHLLSELYAHIERFDPHVVILSSSVPVEGWARISKGRLAMAYVHNAIWRAGEEPTHKLKEKWRTSASQVAGVVASSEHCALQAKRLVQESTPILVSHPQVPAVEKGLRPPLMRKILFLGTIAESRGAFDLVSSFQKLRQSTPDLRLHFLGRGPDELALAARIKATEGATFEMGAGADVIHHALASSDLLVQGSHSVRLDGWPEYGAEAAAHGVPMLLSSAAPRAAYLGGAVKSYAAGNVDALTKALQELIDDPAAYQELAGGFTAERSLIWDRTQSWGSLLGSLLLK